MNSRSRVGQSSKTTVDGDPELNHEKEDGIQCSNSSSDVAARELIPVALIRLPDGFLLEIVRVRIDGTLITTDYKEAMRQGEVGSKC